MKYKSKLYLAVLTGGVLTLACFLYGMKERKELQTLARPAMGADDREERLQVEIGEESYPFSFLLQALPYGEEEQEKILQDAVQGMERLFLKENRDCRQVMKEVCMPSAYPGTDVAIEWYLDSWDCVEPDGTIRNEFLQKEVPVKVRAVLTFGDRSMDWEQEIAVCPPSDPDPEQKLKMLEYRLMEAQQGGEAQIRLPDTLLGEAVAWYPEADDRWVWMLGLTVLAAGALLVGRRREDDSERRKRERSMQLDYSDIVSRLSLYMGAGISTRKAWERIVQGGKSGRPAYEEMATTLREMESGVSEALAYERFGRRCRLQSYLKLGTLLGQNLRKGTKNLAGLLQEESREAFEDRKALAKRMGEECESKLLFPMLMMLLTVLILIMYPAVVSFQV